MTFNFFKIFKYGAAAMTVLTEVSKAMDDGRLTAEEALNIIKVAVDEADIKGVDVDLIEIRSRDDGGFEVVFPGPAVEDWKIDFDM